MTDRKHFKDSYKHTINEIRQDMPLINRLISRIIHSWINEVVFEKIEKIFFRPYQLLLSLTSSMLVSILGAVMIKRYGYSLAGSELIIGFAIGWILGTIIEFFNFILNKKRYRHTI